MGKFNSFRNDTFWSLHLKHTIYVACYVFFFFDLLTVLYYCCNNRSCCYENGNLLKRNYKNLNSHVSSTHLHLHLLSTETAALRVFKRKVLHKTLGSVRIGNACLGRPCRSNKGDCIGETGVWCGDLQKSTKRTILLPLERPNQGSPVIDWYNQLS